MITGGPGYFLPIGSYYDGIDPGTSINGSLSIGTWSSLAFRAQVSFGNSTTEISNVDFKYQRFSAGVLYHSRLSQSSKQSSEFYGYWGIGFMTNDLSTAFGSGLVSIDDTRFMADASIGVILAVSRGVGIDIAMDAPVIYVESTDNGLASAVQFNLRIGLAFTLGTQ